MKLSAIKPNDSNPRTITDAKLEKLKDSIKTFEKMMSLRPIVINGDGLILGGNMRYHALVHMGYKEIPDSWVKRAEGLTRDEEREFIIKDNVGFGDWDWEALANEWEMDDLINWGLDLPKVDDSKQDDPVKDTSEISFSLTDEQAIVVRDALARIKKTDEFRYCETYGNEDVDGNALYLIAAKYLQNG